VDQEGVIDSGASFATPFVDLAGDPMLLRFDTGSGVQKTRDLLRPPDLPVTRAGANLVLLTDDMITREERLITTLPSSREDFAFFQAQRATPQKLAAPTQPTAALPVDPVVIDDAEASWGTNLDGTTDAGSASFTPTKIEDTTSLSFLLPETQRKRPYEDVFLRLKGPADLAALMTENGMDAAASKRFAEAAVGLIPEAGQLGPSHILAMRGALRGGVRVPVQMSLYTRDTYFGSLALNDAGTVAIAADPWVEEDLFSFAGTETAAGVDVSRKYRMLDAFYSAAIRNGVSSAVVAETIVMMSQAHDLEAFAAPGDKMTLLYARDAGTDGPGPGQVLYAAIKGEGKSLECHVFKAPGKEDYGCFTAGSSAARAGGGGLRSGLQTPVQGVLTSRFGPRMHPVLKLAKLHKGVDWAAPIGTPVVAAFDGTIAAAGDGKGYGNLVRISHPGGLETRYAHLNAFADGIAPGVAVSAGTLIGYVGTTGLSTGPHLHFELYEGAEAVDPLGSAGGTEVAATSGSAVELLVDQIIRVESGGNAAAKNPLSTATGLGQFIESTWLRMMQQYRPDLASTLDRAALLALRNDPTISREMVTALAREGEAYLRARGHDITAGRLYLCHFLGAEGANIVLAAQDDHLVGDVMGAGVVNANPFLKGRTVAYIKEWAEIKMNKKGGAALPVVAATPPEVLAYQKIIAALIGTPT
jgi:murein DD-endopeptidase MepM/ murein hydrolase activator NlpD